MSFEAKYPGRCGACDERIHEGDWITYSDDVVVHADCPDAPTERAPRPICDKCWMEIPASGECGCDS